MLVELQINDFAIIDQLEVEFSSGLNILSGETGAGKSILVKSLGLLMGVKTRSDDVKTGAAQATIQGSFDLHARDDVTKRLQDLEIPTEDDLLIVRRVVSSQGKSRVYLNGRMSTLSDLRSIVSPMLEMAGGDAPLIEMTGQHDTKHLLSKNYHIDLLDQFASLKTLRQEYKTSYNDYKKIESEIKNLRSSQSERENKLDFYKYQLNQIKTINLTPGEDETLTSKIKTARNSVKISGFNHNLKEAASDCLHKLSLVQAEAEKIKDVITSNELLKALKESLVSVEELSYQSDQVALKNFSSKELDAAENRLSKIRKLQKIFGDSIENIIDAKSNLEKEISLIEDFDAEIVKLENKMQQHVLTANKLAVKLHTERLKSSKKLEKQIAKELLELNMKGLEFYVNVTQPNELNSNGKSTVEFLTRTGKSDSKKALVKYASGGELSRILLSLKNIMSKSPNPRTYLFDEVDTGVSGETAQKVGKKLKKISQGQQVICVTHLPQVASQGDHHFLIEKSPTKQGVEMKVFRLKKQNRIEEVARLISGEKISKSSRQHAKELIDEARL